MNLEDTNHLTSQQDQKQKKLYEIIILDLVRVNFKGKILFKAAMQWY